MASDRMQLQNMCKKGAQIFQRIRSKVEGSGSPSVSLNDEERNNNNDSRHITSVLLWKMVGYTPSSFADLVFAGEMIEVGLKRGKSDHHALINAKKTGASEESENEGETHVVTAIPIQPSFPPTQQCHYSANNNTSPYPPPSYPQRPSLNQL